MNQIEKALHCNILRVQTDEAELMEKTIKDGACCAKGVFPGRRNADDFCSLACSAELTSLVWRFHVSFFTLQRSRIEMQPCLSCLDLFCTNSLL